MQLAQMKATELLPYHFFVLFKLASEWNSSVDLANMKAFEWSTQLYVVLLIMLYKVVLTFEFVDDHLSVWLFKWKALSSSFM